MDLKRVILLISYYYDIILCLSYTGPFQPFCEKMRMIKNVKIDSLCGYHNNDYVCYTLIHNT